MEIDLGFVNSMVLSSNSSRIRAQARGLIHCRSKYIVSEMLGFQESLIVAPS